MVVFQELTEDGKQVMHATLSAFGGHIMLSDYFPEFVQGRGAAHVRGPAEHHDADQPQDPVEVDGAMARAQGAGAIVTMAATDTFWVMRYGRLRDPYGYVWAFGAPLPLQL